MEIRLSVIRAAMQKAAAHPVRERGYYWLVPVTVLVALGSLLAIWLIPIKQSQNFQERNEARRTVVQICGGGFALVAIALAIIRIQHSARDLAVKQSGERTGRYLRSAELLGSVRTDGSSSSSPNIESRLGAIYSLARLANDSSEDYRAVVQVLASYVRLNATPLPLLPGRNFDEDDGGPKVRIDIQTAVEILAREPLHHGIERPRIDLRNACLRDLEIEGGDLCAADLSSAKLGNAVVKTSTLRGAKLRDADLRFATFDNVGLEGADLHHAKLAGADFSTVRFDSNTEFDGATVSTAKFYADGGPTEEARSLSTGQILRATGWEDAHFSRSFYEQLCSRAAAPTKVVEPSAPEGEVAEGAPA